MAARDDEWNRQDSRMVHSNDDEARGACGDPCCYRRRGKQCQIRYREYGVERWEIPTRSEAARTGCGRVMIVNELTEFAPRVRPAVGREVFIDVREVATARVDDVHDRVAKLVVQIHEEQRRASYVGTARSNVLVVDFKEVFSHAVQPGVSAVPARRHQRGETRNAGIRS